MTNSIMTVQAASAIFSKDAAMTMHDSSKLLKTIRIEDDAQYKKGFNDVAPGQQIAIRKPAKFTTRKNSLTFSGQAFEEEKVILTRSKIIGVDIDGFLGDEMATSLTEEHVRNMSDKLIVPAAKQLISDLEKEVATLIYPQLWHSIGTPGVTPNSRRVIGEANARLNKMLAPDDDRYMIINSDAELELGEAFKGLLNPSAELTSIHRKAALGQTQNFDILRNELMPTHTNGNDITGVAVDGVGQSGSTLHVDGITTGTGTVKAGQKFTISGVYAIHPETKVAYNYLQEFTIQANVTASGVSDADLTIVPAIVTSGARQNVSAAPADDAPITFIGAASTAYPLNLFYQKDAIRFMTVPLPAMKDAEWNATRAFEGIDVTFHHYWDKDAYKRKTRLDVLYGAVAVNGEHGGVLWG